MNLAEIRKKARQQKVGDSQSAKPLSAAVPEPEEAAGTEPLNNNAACREEIPLQEPSGELTAVLPAKEMPAEFQPEFDPVAVLLAGRKTSGTASDTVDAPQSGSAEIAGEYLKCLRFRVADEDYGVSLMDIREIIKPRDVTEVPRMPDFVAGVISLRGAIIPVFDLRLRLGLAANQLPGRERIVIAKRREGAVGLLVDEVHQVINLAASAIENAPPVLEGIDREFVSGIGRHGQRMIILLDLEKVFDISLC